MKQASHGGKRAGAGRPRAPGEPLKESRRRKETALADLREIEVARQHGDLLEVEAVVREWSDALRVLRSRVMAVPSRVRQRLPHLTGQDLQVIDRELRNALIEVADDGERGRS